MNKQEFNNLIDTLLDKDIEITLSKDKTGAIWYNLNTYMKSHLYIMLKDDTCYWEGRYDRSGTIDDLEALKDIARSCMCGRDYASAAWHDFLK